MGRLGDLLSGLHAWRRRRRVSALLSRLNDLNSSRERIDRKLKAMGDSVMVELARHLLPPSPHFKECARLIRELGPRLGSMALGRMLEETNENERRCAAYALGLMRSGRSALVRALRDGSPDVRTEAIRALGRVRHSQTVEPLMALIADASPEVRLEAVRALGYIGYSGATSTLVALLDHDEAAMRCEAARALGRIGDERALPALRNHICGRDKRLRREVKSALASFDVQRRRREGVRPTGIRLP